MAGISKKAGFTYEQLLNYPNRVMGHAHIIAMMLECPDIIHELMSNSIYGDMIL